MEKFFILALPRSRTKWLSEFLSFAGKRCGHDLVVDCASESDFERAVAPLDGTVETGAMLGWKVLRKRWPAAKFLTVHRPIAEIVSSFNRLGLGIDVNDLMLKEQMLLALAQSEGTLSVTFDQLGSFEVCSAIFGHCLEMGLEYDYWAEWAARNVQIDMDERIARLARNASGLASFRASIAAAQLGGQSWGLN